MLDELGEADFPEGARGRLLGLDAQLEAWGSRLSLSGFKDEGERARRYFGEALAAARFVPERGRALDVGSGGGSPALPLAIVRPGVSWLLAESRGRKAGFLVAVAEELGLENVRVEARRVDEGWPPGSFDIVTTRGVALAGSLLARVRSLVAPGGRHLWFSSEVRLREAPREKGWAFGGPYPLGGRSTEPHGWLLVCGREIGS